MGASQGSTIDVMTIGDLATREDEGIDVAIILPNGRPATYVVPKDGTEEVELRPVVIRVAGSYSKRYRDALERVRNQPAKYTPPAEARERAAAMQIEIEASCIISWQGVGRNNRLIDYTLEDAIEVLTKGAWIREQVQMGINDHAAFFNSSSSA